MSLRPRFAGHGELLLPARVSVMRATTREGDAGDAVGVHGTGGYDPFERTDEGLLLAESFARADLARPRKAQAWLARHGVADLARFIDGDDDGRGGFHDARRSLLAQQALVGWLLRSLARLGAHDGSDPASSLPALEDPSGEWVLWLGGRTRHERWIARHMQEHPSFEAMSPRPDSVQGVMDWDLDAGEDEYAGAWWPTAHAVWRRIEREGIAVLPVTDDAWSAQWGHGAAGDEPFGHRQRPALAPDRDGLIELQRLLVEPYVRRAAVHEVRLERREDADAAIAIVEHRRWTSVLAPVFLQLAEALVRVSEGRSGAALCRECGQPFLTLDARRSAFCTDAERLRHTQREHRRRKAASTPFAGKDR